MTTTPRCSFLNPVLAIPWKSQQQFYETPVQKRSRVTEKQLLYTKRRRIQKHKRRKNIRSLMRRFPGIKTYTARAALTISNNHLHKAIILLEVANSCQNGIVRRGDDRIYLQDIRINLSYTNEKLNTALRNVVFESVIYAEAQLQPTNNTNSDYDNNNCTDNYDEAPARTGVVIYRTSAGYKASIL